MLPKELLEILCCPKCRGPLLEQSEPEGLLCQGCQLFYPVLEGIPNLLLEDARPLPALPTASGT